MPTDTRLLTLAQWLSPSFPIGAFAYSHGLEWAVQAGLVRNAGDLQGWLTDLLTCGSGRADAIWVWQAMAGGDLAALDAQARAFAASAERLREAARQGAAFASTANAVWGLDVPPVVLPLAVGAAARQAHMAGGDVVALYAHAFASNLTAAAIRLVPLGQTEGQRVLAALTPICAQLADDTQGTGPDDIYSNCFLSDIAAMRHETQETRLFQS
ncbi:urease accessory protein UreF [Lacimonas salitolerans]|uniref:Urease accessory protein UreF n=1 Tax=Lacimonas salitolerans TaxID=1323750 RepID=A0ABW4EEC4_9RHOB